MQANISQITYDKKHFYTSANSNRTLNLHEMYYYSHLDDMHDSIKIKYHFSGLCFVTSWLWGVLSFVF